MEFEIKRLTRHSNVQYIEEGEGEPIVLLHGLLGALSNFEGVIRHFRKTHKVIVPMLPLYDMHPRYTTVSGIKYFLKKFIKRLGYKDIHLVGNSLGGHVALLFVLDKKVQHLIRTLTLTGSSGLFENSMGATFPKRNNYEYIQMKARSTFYDPEVATKQLVDEIFEIVTNRIKALKIIYLAKSATRNYLGDKLQNINVPTLLIWGQNDIVTPQFVAEQFHNKIPNSKIVFIDKCGHAPMMERVEEFNAHFEAFLNCHRLDMHNSDAIS